MRFAAPTLFLIAIYFAGFTEQVGESVAYKRGAKAFYDRIGPEEQPVRMQRCRTPGTVWWKNACYRPSRIPRS